MKFSGERLVIGKAEKRIEDDHLARYNFTKDYVSDKSVLDVACGTGYGTKMIKGFGATSVVGVDISPEAIAYAKKYYGGEHIDYVASNASKLPFSNDYFDIVVSFETIEHLNDAERDSFLHELFRVLKKGGMLILSSPNRKILSPNSKKPKNPYHFREFTGRELTKALEAAGLRPIKIYGQRQIPSFLCNILAMKLIYLTEKILRKNFHVYDLADSPEVKKIKSSHCPRYYIVVAVK